MFEITLEAINKLSLTAVLTVIVLVGGAIAGAVLTPRDMLMRRIPHFFWTLTITLSGTLAALLAKSVTRALPIDAVIGDILLAVVVLGVLGVHNFYIARCGVARSRDAFGRARWGWLEFTGIGWLILQFAPSKHSKDTEQPGVKTQMVIGGFSCIVVMVWIDLQDIGDAKPSKEQAETLRQHLQTLADQKAAQAHSEAGQKQTPDLKERLAAAAEAVNDEAPFALDDQVTRIGAYVRDLRIVYNHEVTNSFENDAAFREKTIEDACESEFVNFVLDWGGSLDYRYRRRNGDPAGAVRISSLQDCVG